MALRVVYVVLVVLGYGVIGLISVSWGYYNRARIMNESTLMMNKITMNEIHKEMMITRRR